MSTSSLYKDFVITTREEVKGLMDFLDSFDENTLQPQAPLPHPATAGYSAAHTPLSAWC